MEGYDDVFYYDNLGFYPNYYRGPYSIYKNVDFEKITFNCDGPLIYKSDGTPMPYEYCQINSKDYLTQ